MSNPHSQTNAGHAALESAAARRTAGGAPQPRDLSTILGLLAGDGCHPHEGERDIVASAIWRALQSCSAEELPSLSRLLKRFSAEVESRAERARGNDVSLRGHIHIAPVLALCAEIHRTNFVDADGRQARSLLFLALVDLAIHCPELIPSTSFTQAANGLRILLERLDSTPRAGLATLHFCVWHLFDWVAAHRDLASYVKGAVRNLRERFLIAWRAFEVLDTSGSRDEDEDEDEEPNFEEASPDQAFWGIPDSSRYEVELPVELKRDVLATELTRVTAMRRFASASLLNRSDESMTATVAELVLQAARKTTDAPHALAKLVAIAGCLPLNRVYELRWATPGTFPGTPDYPGVLTPDARWLIRSELDPRTTKVKFHARSVHIPIPESLASLLREQGHEPNAGETVLRVPKEGLAPVPREASAWETTLASRLMRDASFGISLAQHVLHTSFGLDRAPLYYDRIAAGYLAHAVARITHPWFGCAPRPHAMGLPNHFIGSQRLVPKGEAGAFLRSLRVGWRADGELWERIHFRSRNLRYGFLLSVAHRTNTSISGITARCIARDDALATIADKAVAIDHPHRLAALGTRVVAELDQYFAELHEATTIYPGTPLACAATQVLAGEQCLFLAVWSADDCCTVTLEDHVAEGPAWAGSIRNWLRQYANDGLVAKLPEALRAAQMGWTGTRSGAISELSTQSALDVLSKIRVQLDAFLKESGWAPLPLSGYKLVARPSTPTHWIQGDRDHRRAFTRGLEDLKRSADTQRREFAEEALPALNAFFRVNDIPLEATAEKLRLLGNSPAVPLGKKDHAALLRAMGADRTSQVLAREFLHALLSQARSSTVVVGPLPRMIIRTWPRYPCPFVRHAHRSLAHRDDVIAAAHATGLSLAARTVLTVLLEGWLADAEAILQLMQPGAQLYELRDKDVLLVEPAGTSSFNGTMAFNGAAATALRAWHRGGDAHALDRARLQAEIYSAIHPALAENVLQEEVLNELEALMRSFWALRAPGIVRDVVTRKVVPTFTTLQRVVALHENHPIWPDQFARPTSIGIKGGINKARRLAAQVDYEKVKILLGELADHWSPAKDAQSRHETVTALRLLVPDGGPRNGGHVVALYAAAYLGEGLRKEYVRPVTVQDAIYSVGKALIQALPEQGDFSRRELWLATYARALHGCESKDRVRLVKDLTHFQRVMAREHDLPMVNLSPMLDALDLPAPNETIGFYTDAEQQAAISMAKHRLHAVADQGSPLEQQEALCALAIIASGCSTSLRDREFRVPLLTDWQSNEDGTDQISLRSNGQDFVKTPAGRRAIDFSGPYGDMATDALNRLSVLKATTSISPSREKLFSSAAFALGQNEFSDVMRHVNSDLRYVTANPMAAIDITRKTWALNAFRELSAGQFSLWPARDLLARMGQAAIATMQAYYLHDPLVFLERMPRERALSRTDAGWILGMNPKAAQRLLGKQISWLRPASDSVTPSGIVSCTLGVDPAHLSFEPSLRDAEALLHVLAQGRSLHAAMEILAWPQRIEPAIDRALTELKKDGVVIGHCQEGGQISLSPASRRHSHPSLEACRIDAFSWSAMDWIFGQWLADWRARDRKGIAARAEDWSRVVMPGTPVSMLSWQTEKIGHMTLYQINAKRKNEHSPWLEFRWLALCAWMRQRILDCPITRTHSTQ